MIRRILLALALAAAAPRASAVVSFGVEATIGAQRLGLANAPGTNEPLLAMGDLGATALLRGGPLAIGLAAEGTFQDGALQRYNASALAGLVADLLPVLRLELLGEIGASDLRSRDDAEDAATSWREWNHFYGFRPGLSAKLPLFPLRVGVWGLARWGLPGSDRGPALGMLGRLGIEF